MATGSSSDEDDNGNSGLLFPNLDDHQIDKDEIGRPQDPHQDQRQHYLKSVDGTLIIRQLRSLGLSFQLWPAASTLVSLLDRAPSSLLPSNPHLRILELGSGTGLVGLAAAAILGAHVTLTDLPHVIPNLRFNAVANAGLIAARGGSVDVRELSWGENGGESDVGSFDVVIGSDVVYYEEFFDPLLKTLRGLVKGEVLFVMGQLRRWKKDSVFFKRARKVFDVELLHTDPPLDGSRIGVAVYRFTAKRMP